MLNVSLISCSPPKAPCSNYTSPGSHPGSRSGSECWQAQRLHGATWTLDEDIGKSQKGIFFFLVNCMHIHTGTIYIYILCIPVPRILKSNLLSWKKYIQVISWVISFLQHLIAKLWIFFPKTNSGSGRPPSGKATPRRPRLPPVPPKTRQPSCWGHRMTGWCWGLEVGGWGLEVGGWIRFVFFFYWREGCVWFEIVVFENAFRKREVDKILSESCPQPKNVLVQHQISPEVGCWVFKSSLYAVSFLPLSESAFSWLVS